MDAIQANELCERAGERCRERIRSDRDSVSEPLRPVLEYLEHHFLDAGFSIGGLTRTCGLNMKLRRLFRSELGRKPNQYLTERKMEIVEWLLRRTEVKIRQIGSFLGYSKPRDFSSAFKAWAKVSPSEFRKRHRSRAGVETAVVEPPKENSVQFWWRALIGALSPEEGKALISWLETKLGRGEDAPSSLLLEVNEGPLADAGVSAIYDAIEGLSPEEMRNHLSRAVKVTTPALFELICQKSIEVGRGDPRAGIQLAELALDLLDLGVEALGEKRPSLRALAWARLGNAYRLAEDHPEARRCFVRANELLKRLGEELEVEVEAETYALEGSLELDRRKFRQAEHLFEASIVRCRSAGEIKLLVKALIQRASLFIYSGRSQASWPDLQEALQHLRLRSWHTLHAQAHQALAISYLLAKRIEESAEELALAQEICRDYGFPFLSVQLAQIEGMIQVERGELESAAESFGVARAGMIEMKRMDCAGVVSIEYAVVERRLGRVDKSVELASEACKLFQGLSLDEETMAAILELRRAITASKLSDEVLLKVRRHLRRRTLGPSAA